MIRVAQISKAQRFGKLRVRKKWAETDAYTVTLNQWGSKNARYTPYSIGTEKAEVSSSHLAHIHVVVEPTYQIKNYRTLHSTTRASLKVKSILLILLYCCTSSRVNKPKTLWGLELLNSCLKGHSFNFKIYNAMAAGCCRAKMNSETYWAAE